jgi:DNA-binding MarR family transcriptional regulator
MARRTNDDIDRLVAQWGDERPDLDLVTMARVARLMELGRTLGEEVSSTAGGYRLSIPEGDILFALRRSGAPYRLTPSQISEALLVPSGTLTSRLDRLEARGAIRRVPNPSDRRSMEVQLTDEARKLVDEAVTRHVANEQRLLEPLSERERAQLDRLARKLLAGISDPGR